MDPAVSNESQMDLVFIHFGTVKNNPRRFFLCWQFIAVSFFVDKPQADFVLLL